jgi:peptidylprolyl isomerase
MRKIPILAMMAALAIPILFAQSQHSRSRPLNMGQQSSKELASQSHPTRVSGEGVATPSGLRYWDLLTGEGEPAAKGHTVSVVYRAWVENGKEFASSISDKKPTTFTLGIGQVIPGWEEGVEGMKIGGRRQLRIPPNLAYGAEQVHPFVPANSTLIYDVELIGLQ